MARGKWIIPSPKHLKPDQVRLIVESELTEGQLCELIGCSRRAIEYHRRRARLAKSKPIGSVEKPGRCPECGYSITTAVCVACCAQHYRRDQAKLFENEGVQETEVTE
jgi:hypothetical protein